MLRVYYEHQATMFYFIYNKKVQNNKKMLKNLKHIMYKIKEDLCNTSVVERSSRTKEDHDLFKSDKFIEDFNLPKSAVFLKNTEFKILFLNQKVWRKVSADEKERANLLDRSICRFVSRNLKVV